METTEIEVIKPKTKKELAYDYECSPQTISRMCREIGIVTRRRLTTFEVKKFYKAFGLPEIKIDAILKNDNTFSEALDCPG